MSSIAHFGEVKKVRDLRGSHCQWLYVVMYVVSVTPNHVLQLYAKSTLYQIEPYSRNVFTSTCISINVLSENVHVCVLHMFGLWCRLSYHLRRTHLFRSLHQRERNVGVSQAP